MLKPYRIFSSPNLTSSRITLFVGLFGLWLGCNQIANIQEGKQYPDACQTVANCVLGEPECRTTTCENERCVYTDTPEGTRLSDARQTNGDCQQLECDGQGQIRIVPVELDVPDDNEACTKDECVGTEPRHVNLPWATCYSGPAGTDLFGNCKQGIQACGDGKPVGACVGERIPQSETCLTILDDDCDGSVNEEGAGCVCVPGSIGNCYPGNQETLSYGMCAAGTQVCNTLGTAYETCMGFVGPNAEVCDAAQNDDDCDGLVNESGADCMCGDGFVSGAEVCDDGNLVDGDACTNQCTIPGCGDGQKNGTEECDDGNSDDLDACTSQCRNAKCGDGFVHLGIEICDDGNNNNGDACTNQCTIPGCGDGQKNGTEECDDGNPSNTDACTIQCKKAKCGDTFIQSGIEECDDGNTANGDMCSAACKLTICGDGLVAGSEACDDGNAVANDGCTNCVVDPGFSCTPNSPSVCTPAPPSCIGLPVNCGSAFNESCCTSAIVPGGIYNRLNNPSFPATVSDFRLERFEVTVGRFRKFVEAYPAAKPMADAGAHPLIPGSGWNSAWNANLPADASALRTAIKCSSRTTWTDMSGANERHPMNCMSWYDAFAFCAWDGGRLPTEAEWNYAAAGGIEQRIYPWGTQMPTPQFAVYDCEGDGSAAGNCTSADILFVGSKSPLGDAKWKQTDMAGNIWEWVLDANSSIPLPCNDCAQLNGSNRRLRGGNWQFGTANLPNSSVVGTDPTNRVDTTGIRCVKPL